MLIITAPFLRGDAGGEVFCDVVRKVTDELAATGTALVSLVRLAVVDP